MSTEYLNRNWNRLITLWAIEGPQIGNGFGTASITKLYNFGRYEKYIDTNSEPLLSYEIGSLRQVVLNQVGSTKILYQPTGMILKSRSGSRFFLLDLYFFGDSDKVIEVMDQVYNQNFQWKKSAEKSLTLQNSYHQIVTLGKSNQHVRDDPKVQTEIIYRHSLRKNKNTPDLDYPIELNIREESLVAVSQFVTILICPQDYIESSIVFSVAIAISSAKSLEKSRNRLFSILKKVEAEKSIYSKITYTEISNTLESTLMSYLIEVEEPRNVGLVLPSLRLECYHESLSAKLRIDQKADSLKLIFDEMGALVDARQKQIDEERHKIKSRRNIVTSFVVGATSVLFLPLSLILGFFGANVVEVKEASSLFDYNHYWLLYLISFGLILVILFLALLYIVLAERSSKIRR